MAFWKPSHPKSPVSGAVKQTPVAPPVRQKTDAKSTPRKTDKHLQDAVDDPNKGFDPYNSGTFNAKHTWSRVDRKK